MIVSSTPDKLRVKEEACVRLFKTDCIRIEQQQENIKKQRRCLQDIDEQTRIDSELTYKQVEGYSNTQDTYAYQRTIASLNQISLSHVYTQDLFEEHQENLSLEERKLARAYEKRQEQFKKDLQALEDSTNKEGLK